MQMLKFCIWNYNKKVQQASNLIGSSEWGKIYKKFEATLQEPTSGLTLCHAVFLVWSVSPSSDLFQSMLIWPTWSNIRNGNQIHARMVAFVVSWCLELAWSSCLFKLCSRTSENRRFSDLFHFECRPKLSKLSGKLSTRLVLCTH